MIRHKTASLVPILVLVVLAAPTATWGSHSVADEQPPTPFEDFRHEVDSWLDPWLEISGTTIADDHAPWLALALYELLLGTTPLPCYWDAYAAYWAVAADLRALGQAPSLAAQEAEFERVFDAIARAEALAERAAVGCLAREPDGPEMEDVEATTARVTPVPVHATV